MGRLRSRSRNWCLGGFGSPAARGRIASEIWGLSYNIFENIVRKLKRKYAECECERVEKKMRKGRDKNVRDS